jgi:hypothetical protein
VKISSAKASPYPPDWERVAELRVFHSTPEEWEKLISWRSDMQKKGWRLLQVSSGKAELIAVFGRTKSELLNRETEQ